ncbi:MAG: efflux RND transporter permease subunit [Gemmatimonadota bacterium]
MIRWSAERPAIVWSLAAAILLAGGVALARLPIATRPQVELPRIEIASSWAGAAPELVESYITAPIEDAVQGVRGVHGVKSTSADGYASLTVELEPDADVELARLSILERLELLRKGFPAGASAPTVGNYVPDDLREEPLLTYVVSGPYTPGALARIVEREIKPRLDAVPGVSGSSLQGGAERQISASFDPALLAQLGLEPQRLAAALGVARVVRPVGLDRQAGGERPVVLKDQPRRIEDLSELPVEGRGGMVFRLGDLASIRMDEDARDQFFRLNGQPAVAIAVARQPGADAIKTASAVRSAMHAVLPNLPVGVTTNLFNDSSVDLSHQLRDLLLRGGVALAIVLLILVVTLRQARAVILVLGSAAVAIAMTALGLYLMHIPVNLLTLAGLGMGIGILVQNGVVVVERLRTEPDTVEGRARAGRRIAPAVLGSTLTTAIVLLPFLYLQGDTRAAFVPFAIAFALALGSSVVTALVMVPALGGGTRSHAARMPRFERVYGWILIRLLRWRWVTLTSAAGLLGWLSWAFVVKVPKSSFSFWGDQRTVVSASLSFPRGSDPESLDRGMREFERLSVGFPGVERVESYGGRDGGSMQVTFAKTDEFGPRPFGLQEELTERALLIGGAQVSVSGRGPGFSAGYGGSGFANFRIKVLGYSYAGVERLAGDLKTRLERIPRVESVDINAGSFDWGSEKSFSVTLTPDRSALARYGVTAQDFATAVAREVQGPVGADRITLSDEELDLSLKAAGARERSLAELRNSRVPNPTGAPLRIGDLATVDEREGVARIEREDQQYVRIVSYGFRGPDKLARRTHEAFMKSISVPPGYQTGDDVFDWQNDQSQQGLWLVFGVGIVLVILTVALIFDSVWATAMVMLDLPLALGGVVAAFWIMRASFTREAAVGVILVVGLAVNHSILLVDSALEKRGTRDRRVRLSALAIVSACRDRAGMIILVTATTLGSLIPLAVGSSADTLFGAIALATAGGVIASTLGAMLVLPAMLLPFRGPKAGNRESGFNP